MKKRWIAFLMAALLVTMLAIPAAASEEETSSGGVSTVEEGSGSNAGKDDGSDADKGDGSDADKGDGSDTDKGDGSDADKGDGSDADKGDGSDADKGDGSDTDKDDGSDTDKGDSSGCKHVWVEVKVPSTCTEAGGVCLVCSVSGCEHVVVKEIYPLAAHTYDSPCDTTCNVCGAVREAQHKFSAGWDYNSTKHWHICTLCGAKNGEGNHYPGPAATEEKDQICLTCGKVMTVKRSHTHKESAEWKSDETGHWHPCEGCDEQMSFEAHKFSGTCGSPCDVCGHVPEAVHVFGETWVGNEEEHWQVCTLCGAEGQHEPHAIGPGGADDECPVCHNASPTVETLHQHSFEGDWLRDSDSHWHECECGEKDGLALHSWEAGEADENGTVLSRCTVCGQEKTETLPPEAPSFPVGIIFAILVIIIIGLVIALLVVLGVFKKPGSKGHFTE